MSNEWGQGNGLGGSQAGGPSSGDSGPDWAALADQQDRETRRRRQLRLFGGAVAAVLVVGSVTALAVAHTGAPSTPKGGTASTSPTRAPADSGHTEPVDASETPSSPSAAPATAPSGSAAPSASLGGHASSAGSTCKTNNLGFSASATGVQHELAVNLKNNGASTCSLHGFPSVHLVDANGSQAAGPDAAFTDISPDSPPTVTIAPGEETRFLLNFIPDTSGSGKTITKISVAVPKDSASKIVDLKGLNIAIAAARSDVPDFYVDPIGYQVGYGK